MGAVHLPFIRLDHSSPQLSPPSSAIPLTHQRLREFVMSALKSAIGAGFAALLLAAAPLPAFAGAAQDAVLAKYVGTWSGSGALTGAEAGNITCKLTFKQSASKLTYSGRCSYSGGPGSSTFNGNITYNDSTGKYVAKSGGKSFNGSQSGGAIVFNMSQSDMR